MWSRNLKPGNITGIDLLDGQDGGVQDCLCNEHAEQRGTVAYRWMKKIQQAEAKMKVWVPLKEKIESWLEGIDGANGEGPAPEGEVWGEGEVVAALEAAMI